MSEQHEDECTCQECTCQIKFAGLFDEEDPENNFGAVYTFENEIPDSHTNFIAFNVPRQHSEGLTRIMADMARHAVEPGVKHGNYAYGKGFFLRVKALSDERRCYLHDKHELKTEHYTTMFELVPAFDYSDDPNSWGRCPNCPEPNKNSMAHSIVNKWVRYEAEENDFFLMTPKANFKPVDLATALQHAGEAEWRASWVQGLSSQEYNFVLKHKEYFIKIAKDWFRQPAMHRPHLRWKVCGYCDLLWETGMEPFYCCSACKHVTYCCKEHQKLDWKNHKVLCPELAWVTKNEL